MFQSQIGPSTSVPAAEPIWASKVCKKKKIIMKQKEKKLKDIFAYLHRINQNPLYYITLLYTVYGLTSSLALHVRCFSQLDLQAP